MHDAWQIGHLFGIPLKIHVSWLVVFGLVSWALAGSYFPAVIPDLPAWSYWIQALVAAAMLFVSVILHELGHSLMARRHGVPIAGITLFVFGGVSEMKEEPRRPGQEFQIAIIGPAISLVLAGVFAVLTGLAARGAPPTAAVAILGYLAWINLLLAIFNLVPAFPMDGGRVLRAALWGWLGDLARATNIAARVGRVVAFMILILGVLQLFGGNFGGLWLVLIGWFIMQAGTAGAAQATLRQGLGQLRVRDVMATEVKVVEAGMSVADLIEQCFLRHTYGGYPVEREGRVVGLVTLRELRDVSPERRRETLVQGVMVPLSDALVIDGEASAVDAFNRMASSQTGRLLVLDGGRLRGLVTLRGLAHLAQLRSSLVVSDPAPRSLRGA
jgi:Zn-dependent protease